MLTPDIVKSEKRLAKTASDGYQCEDVERKCLLKNINWKDRFPKAGEKLIPQSQDLCWLLPKLLHKIRVSLLERKCLPQNIPLI